MMVDQVQPLMMDLSLQPRMRLHLMMHRLQQTLLWTADLLMVVMLFQPMVIQLLPTKVVHLTQMKIPDH